MKRLTPVAAAVFALATSLGATTAVLGKDYVIVSKSQGAGSVNLDQAVAKANGTITGRQQGIGVAFASSNDPDSRAPCSRIRACNPWLRT
jgi:hypothetical protein